MSYQPMVSSAITTNYALGRNIRTVPLLFEGTSVLQLKQNTLPLDISHSHSSNSQYLKKNEKGLQSQNMSVAFKDVFQTYSSDLKENESKFNAAITDGRQDRISDAFNKGEKLLLSNDNARPRSRAKTSLNISDLPRISNESEHDNPNSAKSLHSHIPDINMRKIFSDVPTSQMNGVDGSNNANETLQINAESPKKSKKNRKRVKSSLKGKTNKGRTSVPSTSTVRHDPIKRTSAPSVFKSPNTQTITARVSSEPTSKTSQNSTVAFTLQENDLTVNSKPCKSSPSVKLTHNLQNGSCKTNSSTGNVPLTQYSHGKNGFSSSHVDNMITLGDFLQTMPVSVKSAEVHTRVKSGHSLRSEPLPNNENFAEKDSATTLSEQLSINAKSVCLPHTYTLGGTSKQYSSQLNQRLSSPRSATKVAELTSIYGAVYQTANDVKAKLEDLKKIKKIFLSDKQSGTLKENGMEYPCAPPATPTPEVLRKTEYVPSMFDIRSQRAVKNRLQSMEKDAQKKKDKQKEHAAKVEKQQSKDREKMIKIHQRRQIYALNKIMTDLEFKRFQEFCQLKGLKS